MMFGDKLHVGVGRIIPESPNWSDSGATEPTIYPNYLVSAGDWHVEFRNSHTRLFATLSASGTRGRIIAQGSYRRLNDPARSD